MKEVLAAFGIIGCFVLFIFLMTTVQNVYFMKNDIKEIVKNIYKLDDKVRENENKIRELEYKIKRLDK